MFEILAVLLSLSALTPEAPPQARLVGTEIHPPEIRTGEVFNLRLRIRAPFGYRLSLPDSLPATEELIPAGAVTIRSLDAGTGTEDAGLVEAVYPLQALRPGRLRLPPLRTRLDSESTRKKSGTPGTGGGVDVDPVWGWMEVGSVTVASVLPGEGGNIEPAGPLHLPEPGPPVVAGLLSLVGILGAGTAGALLWRASRGGGEGDAAPGGHEPAVTGVPLPPEEARRRLMTVLEEVGADRTDAAAAWQESLLLFRDLLLTGAGLERRSSTSPEILDAEPWRGTPGGEALRVILEEGDGMRFGGRPVSRDEALGCLNRIRVLLQAGHV